MRCQKCGAYIRDDSVFCNYCGEKVIVHVPKKENGGLQEAIRPRDEDFDVEPTTPKEPERVQTPRKQKAWVIAVIFAACAVFGLLAVLFYQFQKKNQRTVINPQPGTSETSQSTRAPESTQSSEQETSPSDSLPAEEESTEKESQETKGTEESSEEESGSEASSESAETSSSEGKAEGETKSRETTEKKEPSESGTRETKTSETRTAPPPPPPPPTYTQPTEKKGSEREPIEVDIRTFDGEEKETEGTEEPTYRTEEPSGSESEEYSIPPVDQELAQIEKTKSIIELILIATGLVGGAFFLAWILFLLISRFMKKKK